MNAIIRKLSADQIQTIRNTLGVLMEIEALTKSPAIRLHNFPTFFSQDLHFGAELPRFCVGKMMFSDPATGLWNAGLAVHIITDDETTAVIPADEFLAVVDLLETIRQREIAGGAAELVRMRRDELEKECADLRAELDALRAQEPVAWMTQDPDCQPISVARKADLMAIRPSFGGRYDVPLYAAPTAHKGDAE